MNSLTKTMTAPTVTHTSFTESMRRLTGAVTIVTAMDGDSPVGITASSTVSLSAEPPSILVAVHHKSRVHKAILNGASFAVHVLAENQSELARRFAGQVNLQGGDKFDGLTWDTDGSAPVIHGCLARLECAVGPSMNVATHTIFTGLVQNIIQGKPDTPLIYFDQDFHSVGQAIQKTEAAKDATPDPVFGMRIISADYDTERMKLHTAIERMRVSQKITPFPSYQERRRHLKDLINIVVRNRTLISQTIAKDFGARAQTETDIVEIAGFTTAARHMLKNLKRWMRPKHRGKNIWYIGARNIVSPVPKGVVGVIAPSNYPVQLSLVPVATALAAGCRVVLAPSPNTPQTSALLKRILEETFSADRVYVAAGHRDLGADIAQAGLDHVLLTGSTTTGRKVAEATAKTLTPSTLELGGKCPVVILDDFSIKVAAERIMAGKCFNAGQTCVAPDYVLTAKNTKAPFEKAAKSYVVQAYKDMANNPDYTSIATKSQYDRLISLVENARNNGARVEMLGGFEPFLHPKLGYRFPPTLVFDAPAVSRLSCEEAFGPVLTVLTAQSVDEAIAQINDREDALALYVFTKNKDAKLRFLRETRSGGMLVNDVMLHYLQDDLPFGGIGTSGWGSYHSEWGFRTFSHEKPVMTQRSLMGHTEQQTLRPPYGKITKLITRMMTGGAA